MDTFFSWACLLVTPTAKPCRYTTNSTSKPLYKIGGGVYDATPLRYGLTQPHDLGLVPRTSTDMIRQGRHLWYQMWKLTKFDSAILWRLIVIEQVDSREELVQTTDSLKYEGLLQSANITPTVSLRHLFLPSVSDLAGKSHIQKVDCVVLIIFILLPSSSSHCPTAFPPPCPYRDWQGLITILTAMLLETLCSKQNHEPSTTIL